MAQEVPARVLLTVGDQAELVTAERGSDDPERVPVSLVSEGTGIPAAELPGKDVVAVVGDDGQLRRFRRP